MEDRYKIYDRKKGKTLVLLHGYADDLHMFDSLIPRIKEYDIVSINFPTTIIGNQNSYTITELATYVKDIIEELNIGKFSIIGFSLGGVAAVEITRLMPNAVLSITLLCSYPILPLNEYQRLLYRILGGVVRLNFVQFLISRIILLPFVRKIFKSPIITHETRERIAKNYTSLYGTLFKCFEYDGRNVYKSFSGAKQIVVSKDDSVINYKFLSSQAKKDGIEISMRDGLNHTLEIDQDNLDSTNFLI